MNAATFRPTLFDPTFVNSIPQPKSRKASHMLTETHHNVEDIAAVIEQLNRQGECLEKQQTTLDSLMQKVDALTSRDYLTREEAKKLFAPRTDTYTKAEINRFVQQRDETFEAFGGQLDKVVGRVGELVDEKLQENKTELDAIVLGFTTETKQLRSSIENIGAQFDTWAKFNQTTTGQVQGIQMEQTQMQGEMLELRQDVRFVRSEYVEVDKRMDTVTEHTNKTRQILDTLNTNLAPVIAFFGEEIKRRENRRKFRADLRRAAALLITTPRGIAAIVGIASMITGAELSTEAISKFVNDLFRNF